MTKTEAIKNKALSLGYDGCGMIPVDFYWEFHDELVRRSVLFPHSAFLYDLIKPMANVQEKFPWAKSIVVAMRRYDKEYAVSEEIGRLIGRYYLIDGRTRFSREFANWASFTEFLKRMDLEVTPSSSLVPARWSAVRAGLGKFRNNNFVYTDKGSWNVIDTWVMSDRLDYEPPMENPRVTCPPECDNCIRACPTGALSAPYTMDATHCISYLTYNSMYGQADLPSESLRSAMGQWIYGCDLCQTACPYNAKTWCDGSEAFPEPWPLESIIRLEELAGMDQQMYETKVQPRFWYIKKENIWQWKCNALRAMANTYKPAYELYLKNGLNDPNANVRAMATWALERIHQKR